MSARGADPAPGVAGELRGDSTGTRAASAVGPLRYTTHVLILVSPAKSLDFASPLPIRRHTTPEMLDGAAELAGIMAAKTAPQIAELMTLSPRLAELNAERFARWSAEHRAPEARPALLAFDGDVYRGLDASATFGTRDYTHAQKTLRILSGLYGLLRPLDLIHPYRLEMGTRLATPRGSTLYDFWGDRITDAVRRDLEASPGTAAVVNLASQEYFGAVRPERLGARVVTPAFLDATDGGEPRVISFHAKRARGAMAAWMIRERVTTLSRLTRFDGLGYRHAPDLDRPDRPAFVRVH
jgi:uncharacterized protein